MALTGYYKTVVRPRTHRPLSMMKYDPVGRFAFHFGCEDEEGSGKGDMEEKGATWAWKGTSRRPAGR